MSATNEGRPEVRISGILRFSFSIYLTHSTGPSSGRPWTPLKTTFPTSPIAPDASDLLLTLEAFVIGRHGARGSVSRQGPEVGKTPGLGIIQPATFLRRGVMEGEKGPRSSRLILQVKGNSLFRWGGGEINPLKKGLCNTFRGGTTPHF